MKQYGTLNHFQISKTPLFCTMTLRIATNNKIVEYEEVFGQKGVCNFKRSIKIYECVAASNGYSCTKKGSGCGRHSMTTGDYISKSDKTFLSLDWRCF